VTRWDPFLALALVLTVALLVLARASQNALEEFAPPDGAADAAETGVDRGSAAEHRIDGEPATRDTPEERLPPTGASVEQPSYGERSGELPSSTDRSDEQPASTGRLGEGEPAPSTGATTADRAVLTPEVLMANVAVTQALVIAILAAAIWYFEIPGEALGVVAEATSTGLPAVALGALFGAALWVANELATAVADVVGAAYDERVRELLAPASTPGWLLLFGVVLPVIAVAEELLFRAVLIGVPNAAYGIDVWLLAVLSSVAFALGHGAQGRVGVVVTGVLGFVLAAGYVLTGSLLMVVVAHYVINALEFFVHEYLGVDAVSLAGLRLVQKG